MLTWKQSVEHAESRVVSVENPAAFIALGGLVRTMAARLRSRLRIGHGKGVREQEAEPGTLVTGRVSGAATGPRPDGHGSVR